ncbi:hypothetical protein NC652_007817 [Populus alba x Populus x berolinensis]|nr:hypothetical protein NC652_007817 [Populus alba x Populus x berolinensis]
MYRLTVKLRLVKNACKSFHRQHTSHISRRVAEAKASWNFAQVALDESPGAIELMSAERNHAHIYSQLCKEEEAFYKQRSRIQWLSLRDKNTKFFHRSLVHRQSRNRVHGLTDEAGNQVTANKEMGQVAVAYYQNLLAAPPHTLQEEVSRLYTSKIPSTSVPCLIQQITSDEIKRSLFSIPDDKAPGPDGFTSYFFKKCWGIIGADFINAIRSFFERSTLPRCINATIIVLVPKVENPAGMDDYRPISCCNVIYKCISKIMATRLKTVLADIVSPSQSAFVPGRQIADNILLTQELMHNYHLDRGPARCALKVDLRKAFDTISWDFIIKGLKAIGIPDCMVGWIKACISSATFSISLNGELHGFFPSSRGLRQGDPLSPYLFVLGMEGLGGLLKIASMSTQFRFHWRCKQNAITHLTFADDLMIFSHADIASVKIIREVLNNFSSLSGLEINHSKSQVFVSGVAEALKTDIINCLAFRLGSLPVKYLGVPLISSRLTHQHCLPLIERIISRIKLWTSVSLTYAGRLQLIKSTLFSIQVYWSSIFIIPASTVRKIESSLASFLWKGTSLTHSGAKVAWASLCYPINEGGLGIKSITTWNKAALLKLVWRLISKNSSIWVTWVHSVLLRGRSFWYINLPPSSSWSWRKILQSRNWCKGLFTSCIGNGRDTSLWLDYWLPDGRRICDLLPFRVLSSTGLPWNAKVADIITSGRWSFPSGHQDLQPIWHSIHFHPKMHQLDKCIWNGTSTGNFTIDSTWNHLRDTRPVDSKYHLIWFPGHTPRHAFIFWIASMERLYTRDRLLSFGVTTASSCIFCGLQAETHDHLFFQCPYSSTVWRELSAKTLYSWPTTTWQRLLQWAASIFKKPKEFTHILFRMVLSTAVYYIWYERNNRFFNNAYRSPHELMTEAYEIADGKGPVNGRERVGSADMEKVEVGSNVGCMVQLTALEFLPAWSCSREAPAKEPYFYWVLISSDRALSSRFAAAMSLISLVPFCFLRMGPSAHGLLLQ